MSEEIDPTISILRNPKPTVENKNSDQSGNTAPLSDKILFAIICFMLVNVLFSILIMTFLLSLNIALNIAQSIHTFIALVGGLIPLALAFVVKNKRRQAILFGLASAYLEYLLMAYIFRRRTDLSLFLLVIPILVSFYFWSVNGKTRSELSKTDKKNDMLLTGIIIIYCIPILCSYFPTQVLIYALSLFISMYIPLILASMVKSKSLRPASFVIGTVVSLCIFFTLLQIFYSYNKHIINY